MSKTEPTKKRITFEVEIESGGRAHREAEPVRETPVVLSPTRAAAKARARRRYTVLAVGIIVVLAAAIAWAWITNPLANIPDSAVARVNGQFIYQQDVAKRLDLLKFLNELYSRAVTNPPNATSALEDMITELMEVQDAQRAGMVVTNSEVDKDVTEIASGSGHELGDLDEMLSWYNLTMDDLRQYSANTLLILKDIQMVTGSGQTQTDRQNLSNQWFQSLADTTKIERFKAPGSGPAPRVGAEAPDFTLRDVDGKAVTLSSLKGKPVMINFWATWCPPCRAEIPIISQMYKETEGGGSYQILGVATQSDTSTIKAFADEFGMGFPLLPDLDSGVVSTYHVLPIPTTFFIDKDGIIRYIQTGPVTRALMDKWLLGE